MFIEPDQADLQALMGRVHLHGSNGYLEHRCDRLRDVEWKLDPVRHVIIPHPFWVEPELLDELLEVLLDIGWIHGNRPELDRIILAHGLVRAEVTSARRRNLARLPCILEGSCAELEMVPVRRSRTSSKGRRLKACPALDHAIEWQDPRFQPRPHLGQNRG